MLESIKRLLPRFSDQLIYHWQRIYYLRENNQFLQQHPHMILPPAYTLYESYQLNYAKYIEDGKTTAKEILDSVAHFLPSNPSILDWGCGPARISRHLKHFRPDAIVSGSDTNAQTIAWNQQNIEGIQFTQQNALPPLPFINDQFDLIIGFSVLTHIPANLQQQWLLELYRILKPGGIIWVTTHGNHFIQQLSAAKQQQILARGIYTTEYPITGHRMMTSYHHPEKFREILKTNFNLIAHFDGTTFPQKAGKQDLWIGKK